MTTKTINLIAAVDREYGFGKDGKIPWSYPEDFKFFKDKTRGNTVIMGRTTYDDMVLNHPSSKFLPGRDCIVVTSTPITEGFDNVYAAKSVDEAVSLASDKIGDIFFIGGERIFAAGLNMADFVYLTHIPNLYGCDRFFAQDKLFANYKLIATRVSSETKLRYNTYSHRTWGAMETEN